MEQKIQKMFFYLSDSCICIGNGRISQWWTKYFLSVVNVLIITTKISPNTRADILQINFNENDEKTWLNCSHWYFANIWDTFTCCLLKRVLKWCFSESPLAKFFTVCNFGNTLAIRIIFSFKMFNIWCRFQKYKKKIRNFFLYIR